MSVFLQNTVFWTPTVCLQSTVFWTPTVCLFTKYSVLNTDYLSVYKVQCSEHQVSVFLENTVFWTPTVCLQITVFWTPTVCVFTEYGVLNINCLFTKRSVLNTNCLCVQNIPTYSHTATVQWTRLRTSTNKHRNYWLIPKLRYIRQYNSSTAQQIPSIIISNL